MPKEDTQFKKGQSGNPNGRPKIPEAVKAARKLNHDVLSSLMNEYSNRSLGDLKDLQDCDYLPAIDLIVIRALVWTLEKKDMNSRDFLIERMCGKVPQNMNLNANVSNHKSLIDELTEDD